MPTRNTQYICPNCTNTLRPPGQMGRSWCRQCEMYLIPLEVDPDTMEQPQEGEATSYRYTTWRPKSNTYQRDETPEHRFMYIKRTDILVKGAKASSYKPKCTCKNWKHDHGFTTRQRAHRLWEDHMREVERQGNLFAHLH